ncbi:MAG TPA: hydrogenase 4 subunit B [Burkholderiales bacterium]|nr:hydrogenase 4 subunit B [Burkholderiales bacterium]
MSAQLVAVLVLAAAWLAIGAAGLAALHRLHLVARWLFPAGGAVALLIAAAALPALWGAPQAVVLPIGLPGAPFHFRLDGLSAFFLIVLGGAAAGVSLFSAGYFRSREGTAPGLLCLQYHVFLAAMALVILADDAYAFMVMWETMALASFFLVITNHRLPEIRRAAYLYLLIAHIGALAILLCFGVLQANTGDTSFAAMRAQTPTPFWASVAFLLALAGFGAKAGLVPLHVWLPEAHPAAPSPVSALMSGVMLKTAVYGFLRVAFDLLPAQLWWWGVLALALGLASAVFGVAFAAVQSDMKRLLAWSSVENLGLIFAGVGLALLFAAYRMPAAAALALTAALYHVASHAFFKSLLFVATGAVLHATSERSLGRLGGLLRVMPWVGWACLAGVLASAGLPPLGGFVSEWLLLQSFLFTPGLPNPFLNMLVPAVAAVIALVAALAGYVMVKFYGVIFLGRHREDKLAAARDAGSWERLGMGWLVAGCVALGLFPALGIGLLAPVTELLVGARLPEAGGWLLVPVSAARASYGPLIFFAGVAASVGLAFVLVRRLYHGRLRRAAPWDCGFPWQTARMQDTAEGFGQPVRQIFAPLYRMRRRLPSAFDAEPRYAVEVGDHFWHWLYLPLGRLVESTARVIGTLQRGRIALYLVYSFATVIALLVWVTR